MARKFYDDGPSAQADQQDQSAPETESPAEDKKEGGEENEDQGETTLVPKTMFGGKNPEPGQTCTFKVVRDYGDDVELQYVSSEQKPKGERPAMAQAFDQMDTVAAKNGENA